MDTKSPRCSATSNGRPHLLFIEGGPKLAVTLKSRENRVFADCQPHRDRTVRHSKPTARTAMIMCQSRPLEPRADRPRPRGGPSAVKRTDFTRDKQALWSKNELACGPSAPQGRTVRSSLFSPNQRNNLSGTNLRLACGPSSSHGRTVRRSTLNPTREIPFLVQL